MSDGRIPASVTCKSSVATTLHLSLLMASLTCNGDLGLGLIAFDSPYSSKLLL